MSAASPGSVCVSSAITSRPAWRALSSEGTIAFESLGVIIRPFAPAEIRLSTAATCDSLSPSFLPAKDWTEAPTDLAELSAPSFIFTKNGLVSVLVIRPIFTSPPPPPPPPLEPLPPPLSLPQAPRPPASTSAEPTAASGPNPGPRMELLHSPRLGPSGPRQRLQGGVLLLPVGLVKQFRKRIQARHIRE